MASHECKHRHSYLEHYACFVTEHPRAQEKIGFLDIETSNLVADFGIILTWCIKPEGSNKILSDCITKTQIEYADPGCEDTEVTETLLRAMNQFDRVVTYYGSRFDIPFIRTRAEACGVEFPSYGSLVHTDLYFLVRNRFRLSSNRLENACRVILGKTDKTRVDSKYWRGGVRGDQDSLHYILDHNKKDVRDLEKLYHRTQRYGRITRTSL